MKKLVTLVAMAMLFVPATASAFEVVIPYFLDGGKVLSGPDVTAEAGWAGGASFVTVVNLTDDTLTLGVVYTDRDGKDATPTDNTFEINPRASLNYRPVRTDPDNEGIDANGKLIPDAVATLDGTNSTFDWKTGGHAGFGGLRMLLAPPDGTGAVGDYANFASWPPAPFSMLLMQYVFYDFALAGTGMEAGFISKPLETP